MGRLQGQATSSASAPTPAVANQDPIRKHLVGVLPVDRQTVLPEGTQIVELCAADQLPPPAGADARPRDLELPQRRARTPFALALIKGGRSRIGDTVHVPVNGTLVPVEVTGSVLVDPEGARRDG